MFDHFVGLTRKGLIKNQSTYTLCLFNRNRVILFLQNGHVKIMKGFCKKNLPFKKLTLFENKSVKKETVVPMCFVKEPFWKNLFHKKAPKIESFLKWSTRPLTWILTKKNSVVVVFLWIISTFLEQLLYKTPVNSCCW